MFLVSGRNAYIYYLPGGNPGWRTSDETLFYLVAVGRSAVELLADQDRVVRRIAGSTEVAAFSIFRLSDCAAMLAEEKES